MPFSDSRNRLRADDDRFLLTWEDLQLLVRSFIVEPTDLSLGQLQTLVVAICDLVRASGDSDITLREVEELLDVHELHQFTLASITEVIMWCQESASFTPSMQVFAAMPLSTLARIVAVKLGSIQLADVIEFVELAKQVIKEIDVLSGITVSQVRTQLSSAALASMSLGDLRAIVERLVALEVSTTP